MNGSIRVAALAALLASGAVLAQEPYTPAEQPPAATQSPADATPADTMPATPSETTTAAPAEQATTTDQWPEFTSLDKNADGSISRDEARAQSLVASRFGVMDGDGNGALSSDEYQKGRDQSKAPNP
jgi:hypothetical protein